MRLVFIISVNFVLLNKTLILLFSGSYTLRRFVNIACKGAKGDIASVPRWGVGGT